MSGSQPESPRLCLGIVTPEIHLIGIEALFKQLGPLLSSMQWLLPQIATFGGIGVIAALVHYGVLIGSVELFGAPIVGATLVGYICGGIISYGLNRSVTFDSDRPHFEAGWRFAVVAGMGFLLTWLLMSLFTGRYAPIFAALMGVRYAYLTAQLATTLIVMVWSFLAHKLWTFPRPSQAG